jgi:hypothetical protein
MLPVIPLFPLPPKKGGHNSQKCGTGPGKYGGLSTGIIEVIFSRILRAKVRAGFGLARWGFRSGAGFEFLSSTSALASVPALLSVLDSREARRPRYQSGPGSVNPMRGRVRTTGRLERECDRPSPPGFFLKCRIF